MKLLPFNFELIDENKYFISNLAGFSHVLNQMDLSNIIDFGKSNNDNLNNILRNKLFITNDDIQLSEMMIASGLGKKINVRDDIFSDIYDCSNITL